VLDIRVLLDTLQDESPSLSKEKSDKLFYQILEDYVDVPTKAGKIKKIKEDPYYNAVQIKYAYAITCHKAQGGQWKNVFLDIGYVTQEMLGENFYRWLYTAVTRATHRLYLINLPEKFEKR
jgi:exodeoxyribonuclease-5